IRDAEETKLLKDKKKEEKKRPCKRRNERYCESKQSREEARGVILHLKKGKKPLGTTRRRKGRAQPGQPSTQLECLAPSWSSKTKIAMTTDNSSPNKS
ncbi:hypothetical protein F441_07499, partial [Phytophthora nicotianae CJ01A1]